VRELPRLKALVERHEHEPFAIVGVNTDGDKDEYRARAAELGVTWRSAWQGSTDGPLPRAWGVDTFPTVFVLDAKHVIRRVNVRGDELERVVAELLEEERDWPGGKR
jgi:hypothetical protein